VGVVESLSPHWLVRKKKEKRGGANSLQAGGMDGVIMELHSSDPNPTPTHLGSTGGGALVRGGGGWREVGSGFVWASEQVRTLSF
jgi:hypothetical protein